MAMSSAVDAKGDALTKENRFTVRALDTTVQVGSTVLIDSCDTIENTQTTAKVESATPELAHLDSWEGVRLVDGSTYAKSEPAIMLCISGLCDAGLQRAGGDRPDVALLSPAVCCTIARRGGSPQL